MSENKIRQSTRETEEPSHRENGLLAILAKPWVFNMFTNFVAKERTRVNIVQKYVRPSPGSRILEIGCGTANMLSYLPESIAEYTGFDMNPLYIDWARKHWKNRVNCRFFCQKVEDAAILEKEAYDVILAFGIIHHLNDNEATQLFNFAFHTLKPDGALITYDNVYVEDQDWFAKWFISRDRGCAVRTVEGYKQLAVQHFTDVEGDILHDALRIPYTIFIMRCVKRGVGNDLSS